MAGSTFFERTLKPKPGFREKEIGQLIMLATSYEEIGGSTQVKIYRNGELIGNYNKGPLARWSAGDAEVLWGLRHSFKWFDGSAHSMVLPELDAHIEESRIYGSVLTQDEINRLKDSFMPIRGASVFLDDKIVNANDQFQFDISLRSPEKSQQLTFDLD